MIKLTQVTIDKYKCIQNPQTVAIDSEITTIVGMNEAGKTSFLSAIAKTNYFISDPDFKFDITNDYPRNDLIDFQEDDEDCDIIECKYEISSELLKQIEDEFGKDVFTANTFTYTCHYKSETNTISGLSANQNIYLELQVEKYSLSDETKELIKNTTSLSEINDVVGNDSDIDLVLFKTVIKKVIDGSSNWGNNLLGYIVISTIKPKMPKFWYFDDYYPLPGKININELITRPPTNEKDKTSKALFELARIKPEDILNATDNDYEKYIALLEASSNKITKEIFK